MSAYPKKDVNIPQNKDVNILSITDNQVSDKITTVPVNVPPKIVTKKYLTNTTANDQVLSMKDDISIPDKKNVNIPLN